MFLVKSRPVSQGCSQFWDNYTSYAGNLLSALILKAIRLLDNERNTMARERITGKASPKKVEYVFMKRPKKKSSLFNKEMLSPLSKPEQDYFKIADSLKNPELKVEPTIKELSHFFIIQYRFIYGIECIDYNWFNFRNTMDKLKLYLNLNSNYELAQFLTESFIKYSKVQKTLGLSSRFLTISTFKASFIIDELSQSTGKKFDGFY